MKKAIVTILILILIIATGFLYWQKNKNSKINIANEQKPVEIQQPSEASKNIATITATTTSKVATTSALSIVKGEITRGNPNKKQLIFTFDCGAGTNSVDKILEVAQKHGLKVSFFTTGKFTEKNPDTIKKFAQAGHEVFNHTYHHPHLTQVSDEQIKEELNKAEEIISKQTGKTTRPFFRPPYGDRNKHVLEIAGELGYQSVFWTIDALDWMPNKTAEQVKTQIYSHLTNGAIILMHVGDDIIGQILDEVFTKVENDGYKIVPLSEGIR